MKRTEIAKGPHRRYGTKGVGKATLNRWLFLLRELMSYANYTNADFDAFDKKKKKTELVKSITYNYRATWVTPNIEQLIAEIEHYLGAN